MDEGYIADDEQAEGGMHMWVVNGGGRWMWKDDSDVRVG